ncbi:MAG TPA: SIMPL domain-containing protein [Polyangiaceae bacterium]|nr:SIMPL domain-containing protein [Polyangiaceae bacterium]
MRKLTQVSVMCALLGLASGCHAGGHAHHAQAVSESEAIFVTGEGDASAAPDRMRLNLGVEAKSESLQEAMKDCQQRSAALQEALFKLGVQKKDLRTGQFSISQQREPVIVHIAEPVAAVAAPSTTPSAPKGKSKATAVDVAPAPPRIEERWIERYVVSNTLEVVYPDLGRAGELITAAVAAGANNSWGISFEVADPKPLQAAARESALKDAKARAEQLAAQTGVKLGRVLSISEGAEGGSMPPMPMYKMAAAMDASSLPIEGGEAKLRASVHVVYAIER